MALIDRVFRPAADLHIALYRRLSSPKVRRTAGLPVLLLTVRGRRSGREITNPVCYLEADEGYAVAGSAGGTDTDPQWFKNLRAATEAQVEIGRTTSRVRVRVLPREERDLLWPRFLAEGTTFEGYEGKTERVIPIAVLTPL